MALPPAESTPGLALTEAVGRYAPACGFRDAALTLDDLARLLHFANGVTGSVVHESIRFPLRAAPSAGAQYAGEIYVAAQRVDGLTPGLYSFAAEQHELVRLRTGSFADAMRAAIQWPDAFRGAAAVFLLTNVFGRYTWRYANRGYRYALIDTGHIGENLRLAATSAGFGEASELRFHDAALNALLEIDGRKEAVCALHAVGLSAGPGSQPCGEPRPLLQVQYAATPPLADRDRVTERYHRATRLVPAGGANTLPAPPAPSRDGDSLPLGADVPHPSTSVEASIQARRSPESFREDPIGRGELGYVAALARGTAQLRRALGVDLLVLAHRVVDLDPGLYRVEFGGELALQRSGDLERALVRACRGQQNAGRAAAAFLMIGRFTPCAPGRAGGLQRTLLGDRSYRDLLVESGAIGERIYLAAEAAGLAARNLAAFTDDALNDLLGLDGRASAVLHLTVLGHSDDAPRTAR